MQVSSTITAPVKENHRQNLLGKVAVVIDACSELGIYVIQQLVAEGAFVVGGGLKEEKVLEKCISENFKFQKCDIAIEDDLKKIMNVAKTHFGGLDILINNIDEGGDEWEPTMKMQLDTVALAMRHAVLHMEERGKGSIVNLASAAGVYVCDAPLSYSVAKSGVIHLTKVAAAQLGQKNIRVNAVSPDFLVDHKEVADAVKLLASDNIPFMTGSNLIIDRGVSHSFSRVELKVLSENRPLSERVAVVTGSCSGIGLAIAELFMSNGIYVVGGDINEEGGRELELRFPQKFKFRRCDVTVGEDLKKLMRVAHEYFGRLDILINNAGAVGSLETIGELTEQAWRRTLNLLLDSAEAAMRYAAPYMIDQGGGVIVNMASIAGKMATVAPLTYSVAKAGVIHLTKCKSIEYAQHGIRVNSVSPGFIMTNIYNDYLKGKGAPGFMISSIKKQMVKVSGQYHPIPQPGTPKDVAETFFFLATDQSRSMTGQNIVVDGGSTTGEKIAWSKEYQDQSNSVLGRAAFFDAILEKLKFW